MRWKVLLTGIIALLSLSGCTPVGPTVSLENSSGILSDWQSSTPVQENSADDGLESEEESMISGRDESGQPSIPEGSFPSEYPGGENGQLPSSTGEISMIVEGMMGDAQSIKEILAQQSSNTEPVESSTAENSEEPMESSMPESSEEPVESSAPESSEESVESSAPESSEELTENSVPQESAPAVEWPPVFEGLWDPEESRPSDSSETSSQPETGTKPIRPVTVDGEVRAMWFSYLDWDQEFRGKDRSSFLDALDTVLDNVQSLGVNTLIVHARSHGDAMYASDYFPWSEHVSGTLDVDPGYDPFALLVDEAAARGIAVQAWLNPMRTYTDAQMAQLDDDYLIKQWYLSEDRLLYMIKADNGYWTLNPANDEVRQLIADGVEEIVRNYAVEAIHIDDYFYPYGWDMDQDQASYALYRENGGRLSKEDWRRENVNQMVRAMYEAVKRADSQVAFGVSPTGNIKTNYETLFADVEHWCTEPDGYLDYIMPQVYWGFENKTMPYQDCVEQWEELVQESGLDLYIGLAAYKIGDAGNGTEWANNTDMMESQIIAARKLDGYAGIALYDYKSLFRPAAAVKQAVEEEKSKLEALFNS
ncbi:MAG TPA: family 10 glycosylhydrolase [Firmicutes bacterium]|nr:family 10 glycosylhydrolase [Bacillota bacterium]